MTHFFFVTDSAPMSASPRMIEDRDKIAFGQMVRAADSSFRRSGSLIRMVAETVRLDTARIVTFISLVGNSYIGYFGYLPTPCNPSTSATDAILPYAPLKLGYGPTNHLSKIGANVAIKLLIASVYSGLLRRYRVMPDATLVTVRINSEDLPCPHGNSPSRKHHGTQCNQLVTRRRNAVRSRDDRQSRPRHARRSGSSLPSSAPPLRSVEVAASAIPFRGDGR